MKAWKKAALEANGYRVVDIDEFLGLTPEELRMVEMRVLLARLVKRRREAGKMSQGDLAALIKSTQASISKIESAAPGVTLDLVFRSLFALGGDIKDIAKATVPRKTRKRTPAVKVPI